MSALAAAEQRLKTSLARLEAALAIRQTDSGRVAETHRLEAERAALDKDCEILRAECDRLRRRVEELEQRHEALAAVASRAGDRLDTAIDEIKGLLEA
jgi:hypothetical protein